MFYFVSKTAWFFLQPSSLIVLMIVVGLLLASTRRFPTVGLRFAWAGLALLLIGGLSPLSNLLILPLEQRFVSADRRLPDGPVAGIILLGGYEDGRITAARGTLTLNEAGDRLTEAALLAHRMPSVPVIVSGGAGTVFREEMPGTAAVGAWLSAIGIEPGRIILEDRSITTAENARFARVLLKPTPEQRWLLVTSAAHMPRSVGAFRQQGFQVIPWPADFRTKDTGDAWRPFRSVPGGLRRLDDASTEWIGLLAYWALGRTNALFPAP